MEKTGEIIKTGGKNRGWARGVTTRGPVWEMKWGMGAKEVEKKKKKKTAKTRVQGEQIGQNWVVWEIGNDSQE